MIIFFKTEEEKIDFARNNLMNMYFKEKYQYTYLPKESALELLSKLPLVSISTEVITPPTKTPHKETDYYSIVKVTCVFYDKELDKNISYSMIGADSDSSNKSTFSLANLIKEAETNGIKRIVEVVCGLGTISYNNLKTQLYKDPRNHLAPPKTKLDTLITKEEKDILVEYLTTTKQGLSSYLQNWNCSANQIDREDLDKIMEVTKQKLQDISKEKGGNNSPFDLATNDKIYKQQKDNNEIDLNSFSQNEEPMF